MKRSRYIIIPIIILSIFYFSLGCSATEYQDNKPIVLKINEYFIIYTYPVAPYISKQNKVMLPLETFCELIGAEYSFDKKSKLYLISFSNHKAKFKANSNMAWIGGKYVNIGSTTNIFKDSLVVPVGNLLKYFKINSRWDSKTHLLTLNDNRILKPSVIGDFEKTRHDYFIYDAFNLVSYKINKVNNSNSQLEITAKNILGVEIPAGNEDIHPVYIYKNSASWEPISRPQRPRPSVKKDATIKIIDGNYMSLKELKYIVVVARVWNGKFGEKPWYKGSR